MALFPPIVASSMPAFAIDPARNDNQVKIYFTLSEYSSIQKDNIQTVHVSVRNQASNVSLISSDKGNILVKEPDKQTDEDIALNRFSVTIYQTDLIEAFNPQYLYKVQLRFSSVAQQENESIQNFFTNKIKYFSEWSTVCIIKPILPPQFYIDQFYFGDDNDQVYIQSSVNNFYYDFADFTGVYNSKESNQILKSWRVRLLKGSFDENNSILTDSNVYADSGWVLVSANNYSSNTNSIIINISLPFEFKEEEVDYKLLFEIKTYNDFYDYKYYPFQYNKISFKQKLKEVTSEIFVNQEQGYIKLRYVNDGNIVGNLVFRRRDSISNKWEDLKFIQANSETEFNYYDFTPESGITYEYMIQEVDARGRRGNYKKIASSVIPEWEHPFLLEKSQQTKGSKEFNVKQLKLKYDFQISSYKTNISENKTDTIGSKYPFIRRNGNMYYRSFPITGTITHYMDNVNFFSESFKSKNTVWNKYDYIEERKFRQQVEKFLYNMKPKLYKSTQEGNILIKLMEVSLTPKMELDRLVYTFSATAYEIDEPTITNFNKYGIISIGAFNPVVEYSGETFNQLNTFKSDDEPNGNIFKAGQDIIGAKDFINASENSIAKKENYKVGIEGSVLDNFIINYLRITVESEPYLIIKENGKFRPYDDIEDRNNPYGILQTDTDDINFTSPITSKFYQIESSYNKEDIYLGTLFEINGKQIIVSYPNNIYEMKEDFLSLPANTTIVPLKDVLLSVDYTLTKSFVEDTSDLPKRISMEKRVGQIYGLYGNETNLINEIKSKYLMSYSELNPSNGKMDTVKNKISAFSSITFDTDPGVVFNIVFQEDNNIQNRFVINETGELTIDSDFKNIKILGKNFALYELNDRGSIITNNLNNIKYPKNRDLIYWIYNNTSSTIVGQDESIINQGNYYVYYNGQWRRATPQEDSYDVEMPVELMLFYTVTVESDYF